jgi:phosphate:Na+ symporter
MFLDIARGKANAPADPGEHYAATDILNRDIRAFTAGLFKENMPAEQVDLVASLIEEADFSASLGESLHQVARRVKREKFSPPARDLVDAALDKLEIDMREIVPDFGLKHPNMPAGHFAELSLDDLRQRVLALGQSVSSGERGALLALLGSVERAEFLIHRIDTERKSVNREIRHVRVAERPQQKRESGLEGGMTPAPA